MPVLGNTRFATYLGEQEEAQRVIREAEQRFRLLVENVRDYAIFMIDLAGRVDELEQRRATAPRLHGAGSAWPTAAGSSRTR